MLDAIVRARKVSEDGSVVTYDLTSGVDFSNPAAVAKALADEFFRSDASKWFQVDGDDVRFSPSYKVRIVMSEDHGNLLSAAIDDFLKDIKKEELPENFASQIRDETDKAARLKSAVAAHSVISSIFRHSEKKVIRDFITDDLLIDLLDKIEVRTLSGQDLIDWKNLPL